MLRLRPYKPGDAKTIISWCKDEAAFRKCTSDRYDKYPITEADMNEKYINNNGDCVEADTAICTLSCGHYKQEIYEGLGCVDISVEPHFIRSEVSNELIELSKKYTIYGLCDDSIIVCSGEKIDCYGEICMLRNGEIEEI